MKESMRKPVLFFMDLMVVFLAVILTIELIAIAGFTFPFMETGHRTSAFLRRIQDQEYQKCVEYYYENEANGVEPDEELKECYTTKLPGRECGIWHPGSRCLQKRQKPEWKLQQKKWESCSQCGNGLMRF